MPVIITLKNAELDSTIVGTDKSTLFISSTITIAIESIVRDAKDIAAVIKNVFNTLFSLDLYAIIIEKNIMDRNIKNSTITNRINSTIVRQTCISPEIIVDSNMPNVSNSVGV